MTLRDKVAEWLSKEGYPLEFQVANCFHKNGFNVHQGGYITDGQSESLREVDVLAEINTRVNDILFRIYHVVECKWSKDKPWIIFTSPSARIDPAACVAQTIASKFGTAILWASAGEKSLHSLSLFSIPYRPGFGGRQAFGKGNDIFYSAMQSVVSATYAVAIRYDDRLTVPFGFPKIAHIVFPIIVVDGKLFEAYFDSDNGNVNIEEQSKARLHWRGAESWKYFSTLDIVTVDVLDDFVQQRRAESEQALNVMSKYLSRIQECFIDRSLEPVLSVPNAARGIVGLPPLLGDLASKIKQDEMESSIQTNKDS